MTNIDGSLYNMQTSTAEPETLASGPKRSSFSTRKRSKVSRACDECRRKKIRCDASFNKITNNLEKPCTHCSKLKEMCTFERTPLKRGPCKGYSKASFSSSSSLTQQDDGSDDNSQFSRKYSTASSVSSSVRARANLFAQSSHSSQAPLPALTSSSASLLPLTQQQHIAPYIDPQLSSSNVQQPFLNVAQPPLPPLAPMSYPPSQSKLTLQLPSIDTITKPIKYLPSMDPLAKPDVASPRFSNASYSSPSQSPIYSPQRSRSNSDVMGTVPPVFASATANSAASSSSPQTSSTSKPTTLNNITSILNPYNAPQDSAAGLFWKVPYSSSITDRKNSTDSLNSFVSDYSSSSKSYVNPVRTSNNYEAIASDSDDATEFRSAVSSYSAKNTPASPANSFSSLSSINNNISRNLNFTTSPRLLPRTQPVALNQSPSSPPSQTNSPHIKKELSPKPIQVPKSQLQRRPYKNIHYNDQLEYNLLFYFKVVHLNFPLLPLVREDFDAIVNKIPNSGENRVIVDVFCKVFQIFVHILKKDDINIINPGFFGSSSVGTSSSDSNGNNNASPASGNGFGNSPGNDPLGLNNRVLLVKDILHPLLIQLFQIYPLHFKDPSIARMESPANILLLVTLNLMNYIVISSGEHFIHSFDFTFTVFMDLKIHKLLKQIMKQNSQNKTPINNGSTYNQLDILEDDYKLFYTRLYLNSSVLEAIFSLSFGLPRIFSSINVDPSIVDIVYQKVIGKPSMVPALNHLKVGLALGEITSAINFNNDDYSSLSTIRLDTSKLFVNPNKKDLATLFFTLIGQKLELTDYLRQGQMCPNESNNNSPQIVKQIEDYQFHLSQRCSQIITKITDLLSVVCDELSEVEDLPSLASSPNSSFNQGLGSSPMANNSSNSNNNGNNKNKEKLLAHSPFLPLIFRQSALLSNFIRILINSMGFNKELLPYTSTILNDIMLINNYLPLISPFNDHNNYGITNNERINNNYNKFEFRSQHSSSFLDMVRLGGYIVCKYNNASSPAIANKSFVERFALWKLLIVDVEYYLRSEDDEGWLLK